MIVFVGGAAFRITALTGVQWAICILCALPCLLWAVLIRCLPDRYFGVVFDATVNAATVVIRPISKALHVVFHPVAQLFRGMGRVTKRVFKKKGTQEEEKTTDTEQAAGLGMPTLFSTEPVKMGNVQQHQQQKSVDVPEVTIN